MCRLHVCAFSTIVLVVARVGTSGLSRALMGTLCRCVLDDAQLNQKQIHHVPSFLLRVDMKLSLTSVIHLFPQHAVLLLFCLEFCSFSFRGLLYAHIVF